MSHPLYTAVGRSIGMRQLATARIHQQVCDAFPRREVRTQYEPATRTARVRVAVSGWWWLLLGGYHWRTWRRARRVVRQVLRELNVEIETEVRWPKATT